MSISKSDAVKAWRKRTKIRMLAAMGDECQICNYSKCPEALEFHHIDPSEKDFSFGKVYASPKSWKKICAELKKCVLLCANCHREVHAGYATLPENFKSFDTKYENYKEKKEDLSPCTVCGKLKSKIQKTCSLSCAARLSRKVEWDKIDLLSLLQKNKFNFCAVGRYLDISDNAVRKRAKKLGICSPSRT